MDGESSSVVCNVVISKSSRPREKFRIRKGESHDVVCTVPWEFIHKKIDRILVDTIVFHGQREMCDVLRYVRVGDDVATIIDRASFLCVGTTLSFEEFLSAYAEIPSQCPVCSKPFDICTLAERLAHIIRCRWQHRHHA